MRAEGLEPHAWSNGPGDQYTVHAHPYNKVLYCVRGSIRFTLPDQGEYAGVDLRPGDRMDLAAGTRHGAVVGPDGCQCMEGQVPA
jgi:quercetin dioxygenase-like cupin family protein